MAEDVPTPPTTGTATPHVELDIEQAAKSLRVSLADLSAKATALYAHKNFEEAAEMYAQAAEMQAEINGEMSAENAEILFLYGRTLFRVGQSKSDVLGGKAPDAKKPKPVKAKKPANGSAKKTDEVADAPAPAEAAAGNDTSEAIKAAEVALSAAAGAASGAKTDEPSVANKPLFQFEGDENFDDSDEEEDAEEGEGEEEEDDDDLGTAFEILDLARVLFTKKIELLNAESDTGDDKGKEVSEGDSPAVRHVKERLADTHDLLAEISLENERYPNAITDFRESLKYKQELCPEDNEVLAEAHFKLSLALEFASVTTSEEDEKNGVKAMDQDLRDEAATEMEAAIAITKVKLQSKEVELATLHNPEDNEVTRTQIADCKDMIADMEQRLVDLKKPPLDVNAALGAALGGSVAQPDSRIEEAKKNATDLTGLVRKKRKAEEAEPAEAEEAKKAKVEEAQA